MRKYLLVLLFFLNACAPSPSSVDVDATLEPLSFYSSPSTETWIPLIYTCADRAQIGLVARTPNIAEADISLRVGATRKTAYQIGEVSLVIAAQAENPVPALSEAEVKAIYTGRIHNWADVGGEDAEIHLWVYEQDDDLQVAFNEKMLESGKLSSMARQVQNQEAMRREIAQDADAIGMITQAQADENLRILYSLGEFPVLVIPREEMQGDIFSLLSCLQKE